MKHKGENKLRRMRKSAKKVSFISILQNMIPKIIKVEPLCVVFIIFITALNSELIVLLAVKLSDFIKGIFLYSDSTINFKELIGILIKLLIIVICFEVTNLIKKVSWSNYENKVYLKLVKEMNDKISKLDCSILKNTNLLKYINNAEEGLKKSLSLTLRLVLITIEFLTCSLLMVISTIRISKILSILIIMGFVCKYIFTLIRGYSALKFKRNCKSYKNDYEYCKDFIIDEKSFKETWFTRASEHFLSLYEKSVEDSNKNILSGRLKKTFYIIVVKMVNVGLDLAILLAFIILFMKGKITFQCLISFYFILELVFYSKEDCLINNIVELFSNMKIIKNYIRFLYIPEGGCEDIEIISSGSVLFKNVYFTYPDEEKSILKDMWLNIKSGEKIAIVGASPSEKLALLRLITGIYKPSKGDIFVGGVSTKVTTKENVYKLMSIISNNYSEENLILDRDYMLNSHNNKAFLEELIRKAEFSKNTMEYLIGKTDKVKLLEGELQKISIIRGLVKKHSILVVDEYNSKLSNEEEKELYSKFKEYISETTCIFFSDNLRCTKLVDKIVVIDRGAILQVGSHDELINRLGKYKNIYDSRIRGQL